MWVGPTNNEFPREVHTDPRTPESAAGYSPGNEGRTKLAPDCL